MRIVGGNDLSSAMTMFGITAIPRSLQGKKGNAI
jgi:hypothetical protein